MAAFHGKDSKVLLAKYNLTPYLRSFDPSGPSYDEADTSTMGNQGKSSIPGQYAAGAKMEALFDGSAGASHDILRTYRGGANQLLTYGPASDTLGLPADLLYGWVKDLTEPANLGSAIMANSEMVGALSDSGHWLHALIVQAATGGLGYSSVDNGASSAAGGVAHLHATAVTGAPTSVAIKVQHAPDNVTWADLISFTLYNTPTSERKTVAGTVDRYVRAYCTIVGGTAPTTYFAVAFARY